MKKIYNHLFLLLCLLPLAVACDDGGEEVVNMVNEERIITITGVSPSVGYAGEEITINGTNFGISPELVSVFVGEDKTEVISCEDSRIVVKVPEEATTGKLSLTLLKEQVNSDITYTIMDKPSVTAIDPLHGFPGDQISIIGSDFGSNRSLVTVLFTGQTERANVVSCENEKIVVEIPEGAQSGKITLQISQQRVNTPDEFTVLERATFTGISPETGYKRSQITLNGSYFGEQTEGIVVFFDEKEAVVVACTHDQITVIVPEDAKEGENTVSLQTPYEKIETTHLFTVLPDPVVTQVSPENGYVDAEVVITGTNFTTDVNEISVLFGKVSAEIISATKEEIKVKIPIPENAIFGETDLTVQISGLEIYTGTFTINGTPIITSVETENGLSNQLARVGEVITIKGIEFTASTVQVYVGGTQVEPVSITATEIKVVTPNNFNGGKISLQFDGISDAVEGKDELQLLQNGTDITSYVLKNSHRPFEDAEGTRSGTMASPAYWILNEAAQNNKPGKGGAGLQGEGENAVLAMQSGWDYNHMENGKMYQETTLPKGSYEFVLDVTECGTNGGRFGVVFAVIKGANEIPDLVTNTWELENTDNVLEHYRITDNRSAHQKRLDPVTLNEETPLTVGFVGQITEQGWVKLSAISVYWKE